MCLPEQNGVLKDTPFLASLGSDSCGSINLCYSVSLFSLSTNIYFYFSVENWFLLQDHVSVIRDDLGGRLGQVNWSLNIFLWASALPVVLLNFLLLQRISVMIFVQKR